MKGKRKGKSTDYRAGQGSKGMYPGSEKQNEETSANPRNRKKISKEHRRKWKRKAVETS